MAYDINKIQEKNKKENKKTTVYFGVSMFRMKTVSRI